MKQMGLALEAPTVRNWGGRRKGAGRYKKRKGSWVSHGPRPFHDWRHPVHVTLRVRRGVPNLRGFKLAKAIAEGLRRAASAKWARQVARRKTFRVIHYSTQKDHLHLIVEASSKVALGRGMQGLVSGIARRVNNRLGRRGAVFGDHYHGHAMRSPVEVRHAIVYVLKNYEKHPEPIPERSSVATRGIDPCSSAAWFKGWAEATAPPGLAPPVAEPHTWLLRVGWKQHGLLERHEGPKGRPGPLHID